jgi:hypothetical protein
MTDQYQRPYSSNDPRRQLLDDDPPPIRRNRRRPLLIIAGGVILFTLIIIVLINMDRQYDPQTTFDDSEFAELIAPRALDRDDLGDDTFDMRRGFQPQLSRGGWIQIADEHGRLAQQYRCERLDPLPDGWLRMDKPEMEVYLSRNRVLTLRGDSAHAHAPSNAIESGTVTGNVVVKLFEAPEGREIDVVNDQPALVVNTDEASFDNFLGEIRCNDWVTINTPQLELPGRHLSLLHDDQNNRFQLRIQHFDYIRLFDDRATTLAVHETSKRPNVHTPKGSSRVAERIPHDRPSPAVRLASMTRTVERQPATPQHSPDDATHYLLTIDDRVRIDQGELASRRIATGDRLELIFSTESEGIQDRNANAPNDATRTIAQRSTSRTALHGPQPRSTYETIAMMSLAAIEPDDESIEHLLGPGITLVRGEGPLTIAPLDDADARRPADQKDAYVELRGSPVTLCDVPGDSEAFGAMFTYATVNKQIELIGSDSHPLLVDSPELAAGGERFRFSDLDGVGGFDGPGWMVGRERPRGERSSMACHRLPSSALASAGARLPAPPIQPEEEPELQITWDEGMNLIFEDEGERSHISKAIFRGNVRVTSAEFVLNAGEMTVGFPKDAGGDTRAIETIHAQHNVRVVGAGTDGEIQCQDLFLTLEQDDGGETLPKTMRATGDVQAMEDDHILWADSLFVTFRKRTEAEEDAALGVDAEDDVADRRRNVEVDEVTAQTDVQVLLADGTRAFADRLFGEGAEETLELTGESVFIVSDAVMIDQGSSLIFNRKTGLVVGDGPGVFRSYQRSIMPEQRDRIRRPVVDAQTNPLELHVRWQERMTFDSEFNNGAGAVDFRGDVDAVAEPNPLERSTMKGQALTLEFVHAPLDDDEDEESLAVPDEGAPLLSRSRRDLSLLLARRDAKLESHTWDNPEREGEHNVFYVAGQHVEYRPPTNEALVVGDGELLIHNVLERGEDRPQTSAPFGSRGTTTMTWSRRLHLTNPLDELYQLAVNGEITMRHRDPAGKLSWMTSETLDATMVRISPEASDEPRRRGGLDFGGSTQLERVRAGGGVNVNTDQREVVCDDFDYDVRTGIARATAERPGVVAMQTIGTLGVTTAQEIVWNMELDTIRIARPAGVGAN